METTAPLPRRDPGGTSWNKGKAPPHLRQGVVIGAGGRCSGPSSSARGENRFECGGGEGCPAGATALGSRRGHSRRAGQDARGRRRRSWGSPRTPSRPRRRTIPLAKAVQGLLDHSVEMDKRIELILNQIEELRPSAKSPRGSFVWGPRCQQIVD